MVFIENTAYDVGYTAWVNLLWYLFVPVCVAKISFD
jgi:hypothetical protein